MTLPKPKPQNMDPPVHIRHIMILTGEPSGDFHASHLVREANQIDSSLYFSGIGGTSLENQGVDLFYNISNLSAMGVTEVLSQAGQIKKAFSLFKEKIRINPPDLLILIDYPGFNLKAARIAKEQFKIKILYYITPKVWAWKKSRLKLIKKYVDHAALIFPFEEKLFKKARIPSTYVGNPLVDEYPEHLTKPFINGTHLSSHDKGMVTIGLLPGSREAEINNLLDIMLKSADLIYQRDITTRFIISQAGSIKKDRIESGLKTVRNATQFQICSGPVKDILLSSDMVIAASGTVTLEAALLCVPTILIYKMSPISYRIARTFVKIKYAGLANLIAGKEVMPEFLQDEACPKKISQKALHMLGYMDHFQNRLKVVRTLLGRKGAAKRAAKIAINML